MRAAACAASSDVQWPKALEPSMYWTRIFCSSIASSEASTPRRRWTPWVFVSTVALDGVTVATAADGPITPCICHSTV